jgi:DNA-directed RNA polymerase subunit beta'
MRTWAATTSRLFGSSPSHLIRADTGIESCRNVQLSPELEEAAAQVQQEVTAAIEAEERELEQMRMEGEQEELAAE